MSPFVPPSSVAKAVADMTPIDMLDRYALELAVATTREEAREVVNRMFADPVTRYLGHQGLTVLAGIARRRLARFADD